MDLKYWVFNQGTYCVLSVNTGHGCAKGSDCWIVWFSFSAREVANCENQGYWADCYCRVCPVLAILSNYRRLLLLHLLFFSFFLCVVLLIFSFRCVVRVIFILITCPSLVLSEQPLLCNTFVNVITLSWFAGCLLGNIFHSRELEIFLKGLYYIAKWDHNIRYAYIFVRYYILMLEIKSCLVNRFEDCTLRV